MPWEEMRVMDQRVRFAGALVSGLYTIGKCRFSYTLTHFRKF